MFFEIYSADTLPKASEEMDQDDLYAQICPHDIQQHLHKLFQSLQKQLF